MPPPQKKTQKTKKKQVLELVLVDYGDVHETQGGHTGIFMCLKLLLCGNSLLNFCSESDMDDIVTYLSNVFASQNTSYLSYNVSALQNTTFNLSRSEIFYYMNTFGQTEVRHYYPSAIQILIIPFLLGM